MRRAAMLSAVCATAALCGGCDASSGAEDGSVVDQSVRGDLAPPNPLPPVLGVQIDRIGRPAINTALTDPFYLADATGMPAADANKDAYNADSNPAAWVSRWSAAFESSLAVFDALDGKCGNQLLASPSGADAGAGRYAQLAATLADDQLYLDTTQGSCAATAAGPNYLAVEARHLGLPLAGCGGRTPLDDAIDVSYTVLGAGTDPFLAGAPRIVDGIDADADGTASLKTFPFLAAPN